MIVDPKNIPEEVIEAVRHLQRQALDDMDLWLQMAIFQQERTLFRIYGYPRPWYFRACDHIRWYVIRVWDALKGKSVECDCDGY